ncbi:MAG: DNA-directed RNA polymerase [Thermoplasmata archaeon]|nr:DNA-directed RNA polymerase [Thermoplasmata archaeon]
MYISKKAMGVVRIPPERLGENLDEVVEELARQQFEGKYDQDKNLVVLARNVKREGPGRVVHGDGAVYQNVAYDALLFRLTQHEVVQGFVCDVLKFGAFLRIGPVDALVHISQVIDDHVDADVENKRLIARETKRDLRLNDEARARVVSISINERNPRESKIGLTMRQPGLGKIDWLEEDREAEEEAKQGKEE